MGQEASNNASNEKKTANSDSDLRKFYTMSSSEYMIDTDNGSSEGMRSTYSKRNLYTIRKLKFKRNPHLQ